MATRLSLPRDLIREVDETAGPQNRGAFVEAAVRQALRREQLRVAIEKTARAWRGRGQPSWEEPDGVVKWVRELRTEDTGPGPG